MPRISGVSATSTVWCMRRRPSPRTVARCLELPEDALHERHLDVLAVLSFLLLMAPQPMISSTRLAALRRDLAPATARCVSAFIVARTTLIGLREP